MEYTDAYVENLVFFEAKRNTYSDVLRVQTLDGGFNIINIYKKDITGEIVVYFKDCENDLLCGGITYRGRMEGGLKAGEIRQVMSKNFTQKGTKVMFITIAE